MIVVLRESVWNATDETDDTLKTLSISTRRFASQSDSDNSRRMYELNRSQKAKNLNPGSPASASDPERSLGPLQFNVNISPSSTVYRSPISPGPGADFLEFGDMGEKEVHV